MIYKNGERMRDFLGLFISYCSLRSLSENCSLLGTDNVRGQISEHIFASNGDYCLFSKFSAPTIAILAF